MRDPTFERDFLAASARSAGLSAIRFPDLVEARLATGEGLYGRQALDTPPRELCRELTEEGCDLGAWSVLMAQSTGLQELTGDRRIHVLALLQRVAARGAQVESDITRIREILDE